MGVNVAVVFTSLSGNTEELAMLIVNEIELNGGNCDVYKIGRVPFSDLFEDYDLVLFGSYTWDDGALPIKMKKQLREILIDFPSIPKRAAVFGTGDTQYKYYCRAVDEIEYHLENHGVEIVQEGLKIEQFVIGKQITKTKEWVKRLLQGEYT